MSSGTVYGGKNGDLWINASAGYQLEQWSDGEWVAVQFGPSALSFSAGGTTVTVAATAPASPDTGDIWYDTAAGNAMNVWNGSAWVPYQFGSAAISATARQLGGTITTVAASAPGGAIAGDLWIDTASGNAIYQYSGSAWVLYQFGSGSIAANSIAAAQIVANTITASQIAAGTITATQIETGTIVASLIAAGTITATQIAAGTITASNIASGTITGSNIAAATITASNIAAGTITAAELVTGIVVAGITNSTVVNASSYVCTSAQGEFLAYSSSSPASGTLLNAIAGSSGTDGSGNPYPQGLYSQQLTLNDQASAPPAFSGSSVFFSSVAGRPRYLSSAGADMIIDRSSVNVAEFPVGNTTTPTPISAYLPYSANEAVQSSAFEIEISGNGVSGSTSGTTGGTQLAFQLYIDGSQWGAGTVVGGAAFNAIWNVTSTPNFRYTYKVILAIVSSGSGGTAVGTGSGTLVTSYSAIQAGSTLSLGGITSGPFDTTSDHTLQLYAYWNGSSAAQALTTFITRLTRRD